MKERSAELARSWIEAWSRMDLGWFRENLASDFVHVSPFGRLEGREHYLATVEPMARKSVVKLVVKQVVATGNQAAVWFENRTSKGVVESCDWVCVESGEIKAIRSFYDRATIQEILSPADQRDLEGSD